MNCKQVIVVRRDLNMRKGKIAAQVAHAAQAFLLGRIEKKEVWTPGSDNNWSLNSLIHALSNEQFIWLTDPESAMAKVVVGIDSERELRELVDLARAAKITVHEIIDAGRTEFNGVATFTVAAFGPHEVSKLDKLTGHLKLL